MNTIIDGINYSLKNGDATIVKQNHRLSGDIVIPETITYKGKSYLVKKVEDHAFRFTEITGIKLPDCITSLGNECFYGCSSLITITLPNSITKLGQSCFASCWKLTSIILPNSITELGENCFSVCCSLTSINLPDSITELRRNCFDCCHVLSKITCGWKDLDKVSVGHDVFNHVDPYCALYVPKGTKSMYAKKDTWCDFKYIIEPGEEATIDEEFATIDGIRYHLANGEASIRRQLSCLSGDIVIPKAITYNGKSFLVTKAEDCAFANARITSIDLPQGITSLGDYCFDDCYSLVSVKLPDGITRLGDYCFNWCFCLTSIDLPDSINSLGTWCFDGCKALTKVTCRWKDLNVVTRGFYGYNFINSETTLYVPKGTKSIYESKEPWNLFENIIEIS